MSNNWSIHSLLCELKCLNIKLHHHSKLGRTSILALSTKWNASLKPLPSVETLDWIIVICSNKLMTRSTSLVSILKVGLPHYLFPSIWNNIGTITTYINIKLNFIYFGISADQIH